MEQFILPTVTAIIGFLVSIPLRFGEGFVKEFFDGREKMRKKKEKLADFIMDFCIEGSSAGYNVMPGDQRHIQRIKAEIEAIDKDVADKLNQYLSMWILVALPQAPSHIAVVGHSRQAVETAAAWQREARELSEELLAIAREWKR